MTAPPPELQTTSEQSVAARGDSLVAAAARRLHAVFSAANLAMVVGLLLLLLVVSERWWFSIALTYLPRAPYLAPSLLLVAMSLALRSRWVWGNLFALLLVAGPLMGLRIPWGAWTSSCSGPVLTIATCNLQAGAGDLTKVARELAEMDPDVVVLQEAARGVEKLSGLLEGWSRIHLGEYLVASKYPVRLRGVCRTPAFGRATAVLCEVQWPEGAFLVCDVHLTTARHGLTQLRPDSPVTRTGIDQLLARQELRAMEAFETRAFTSQHGVEMPLLAVGDFNTPTSSSLFQRYWRDLSSAFDVGGLGYGYTSPCSRHRRWPDNTPWLRIDHILCSSHWQVDRCWVGRSDGSDHRPVAARLRLRETD